MADTSNGEDEVVLKAHLAQLQKESHKTSPDLNFMIQKLERTFTYRRSRVYNPELSVADILSEFPALKHRSCFSSEAWWCKVKEPAGVWQQLHSSIPEQSKHSKRRCKRFPLYERSYLECLDSTLDKGVRKECGLKFAMQLLPSLFGESEDLLLLHNMEEMKHPTPVLAAKQDGFQLYINGNPVFTHR